MRFILKKFSPLIYWQENSALQVRFLIFAASGFLTFILLQKSVLTGEVPFLDQQIMLSLRNPQDLTDPLGPAWVEEMALDLTALGSHAVIIFATCFTFGLLLILGKKRMAGIAAAAVISGQLLSMSLKLGLNRARPPLIFHQVKVFSPSFPSGHSMLSAITFLSLAVIAGQFFESRAAKSYLFSSAIFLSVTIGLTRIYLGVHWPSDVLAGLLLGVSWAALWLYLALRFFSVSGVP